MFEVEDKKLSGFTFIDLFAGIGGFHIALSSYGAQCVYASEINKACQEVYYSNFGLMPDGDITKVDENTIPDHDILCAGFPCQPFSISGKQKGFDDTRGTLFFDVARIVKCKKPKIVFLENVKNFVSHDNGNTLKVVKETMEGLGYVFFYKVLNACDYNVPQKRERIYMICIRKDLDFSKFSYPASKNLTKHVCDLLEPEENVPVNLYYKHEISELKPDIENFSNKSVRLGTIKNGGQGERIYSTKGVGITLSANGGGVFSRTGGYYINGKVRKLATRECARMMGFPDSYKISNVPITAYTQFGNSIVVDVVQYIVGQLCNVLVDK